MSGSSHYLLSRRTALASLAAAAACGVARGNSAVAQSTSANDAPHGAGPVFSPTGPDAELYGATEGFPLPGFWARLQGNPYEPKYRVGAFSHFDKLLSTRTVKRSTTPWLFKRSQADIRYSHAGKPSSISEYLSRNPVTGLLIAKDDQILLEHYQYGRSDRDRFISQSMVKGIMGVLIGIAISDGAINAVLRDYARLGRLLAHDGAWEGKQIIPVQWMIDATTVRPSDAYLAPGRTTPNSAGYGYLVFLLPGMRRQFALTGIIGQYILIDPASKLVMVQTAVDDRPEVWRLWAALVAQFGQG
jgi:CubicO group peptidase (beta-lactamase class C family)